MKVIEFPFVKNGFTHELLARKGAVALVRRSKSEVNRHFEVIVIRVTGPNQFIPYPYEKYPSAEDWGTYGFTFQAQDFVKAKTKFEVLAAKYVFAGRTFQDARNGETPKESNSAN